MEGCPEGKSSRGGKLNLMNSKFTVSVIKRQALELSSHVGPKGGDFSRVPAQYTSMIAKEPEHYSFPHMSLDVMDVL